MNRDDIIKLTREAGMEFREHADEFNTAYCDGIHRDQLARFADLVAQRQRDELVVMFLEAHEGAKDNHNYWLVAANKIKERT